LKILDLILLAILLLGGFLGFRKGLLLEIITFLGLVIGIISAFKLLNTGIEYIRSTWGWNSIFIPYIAFIAIFILVFFGMFLLGKALKKILDFTLIGSADNIAGAILGMLKMAFGLSLVLWLTRAASIEFPSEMTSGSVLFYPLVEFAPKVANWVSYIIPFQDIFPSITELLNGKT
jgi:membrane protein required for colicin V production